MSSCGAASPSTPRAWPDAVAGAESSATTAQARLSQRRILLIVALVAAVLIAFFAVQNLAVSAVYYLTPTEARDKHIGPGTPARLGGLVVPGTMMIPRHGSKNPEKFAICTFEFGVKHVPV